MSCHVRKGSFVLFAVGLFGLAAFTMLAGADRERPGSCCGGPSATMDGGHHAAVVLSAGDKAEEPAPGEGAGPMCKGCKEAGGMCEACKAKHAARLEKLSAAVKAIESARSAVESGDKETALARIDEAHKLVKAIHEEAAARHQGMHAAKFVNSRCPIMGTAIDAAKVPESLIREYKGGKVAFCCGGCPAAWDKLSDAEKEAKLEKARGEPQAK